MDRGNEYPYGTQNPTRSNTRGGDFDGQKRLWFRRSKEDSPNAYRLRALCRDYLRYFPYIEARRIPSHLRPYENGLLWQVLRAFEDSGVSRVYYQAWRRTRPYTGENQQPHHTRQRFRPRGIWTAIDGRPQKEARPTTYPRIKRDQWWVNKSISLVK